MLKTARNTHEAHQCSVLVVITRAQIIQNQNVFGYLLKYNTCKKESRQKRRFIFNFSKLKQLTAISEKKFPFENRKIPN